MMIKYHLCLSSKLKHKINIYYFLIVKFLNNECFFECMNYLKHYFKDKELLNKYINQALEEIKNDSNFVKPEELLDFNNFCTEANNFRFYFVSNPNILITISHKQKEVYKNFKEKYSEFNSDLEELVGKDSIRSYENSTEYYKKNWQLYSAYRLMAHLVTETELNTPHNKLTVNQYLFQ